MSNTATEEQAQAALSGNKGLNLSPFLIALWIDAILLGAIAVLCVQWVARSWRAERPGIKVLVGWTTLASSAYTAWLLVLCLRYFVFGFGEYLQFEQVGWLMAAPLLNALIAIPCQGFYIYRAWMLHGKHWLVPLIFAPLLALQFSMGVALKVRANYVEQNLDLRVQILKSCLYEWCSSILATDILIVVAVAWGLWKNRTASQATNGVLWQLLILTLETQLFPTLLTLAFIIAYVANPASVVAVFFKLIVSKFYVLGLHVTLAMRYKLQDQASRAASEGIGGSGGTGHSGHRSSRQRLPSTATESYSLESMPKTPTSGDVEKGAGFDLGRIVDEREFSPGPFQLDYQADVSQTDLVRK